MTRFRSVLDGLSNTIAMGEIVTDLGDGDKRTQGANDPGNHYNNPSVCEEFVDVARPLFWDPNLLNAVGSDGPEKRRGMRWAHGKPMMTGMMTILPPNGELCFRNNISSDSTAPAGSRHQGGCHVLMGDGAIKFITESIEAGNQNSPSVGLTTGAQLPPGTASPYGLWGSLGTRAAKEVIEADF